MREPWLETVLADLRRKRDQAAASLGRYEGAIEALSALAAYSDSSVDDSLARAVGRVAAAAQPKDRAHRRIYEVRPTEGRCENAACGKTFKHAASGKLRRYCSALCGRRDRTFDVRARAEGQRVAPAAAPKVSPPAEAEGGLSTTVVARAASKPKRTANLDERLDALLKEEPVAESSTGMKDRARRERALATSATRRL